MRDTQLRRFFLSLTALASPIPLAIACGGTVIEHSAEGTGGAAGAAGSGGYPVFTGAVASGGAPIYNGLGPNPNPPPVYTGTGGTPIYMGAGGAAPIYTGTGGRPPMYLGGGAYGYGGSAGAFYIDAGPDLDAGRGGDERDGASDFDGGECTDGAVRGPSGCGRRPPGLEGAPSGIGGDLRSYFQEMARLEAASVPAFRRLRRELRLHGAPPRLLASALRAARDEVVHTRLGRTLAERFGGSYTPPRIARAKVRSLEELAADNATEGGVRETFGALVATWQSRAATDPVVRRVMRRVAVDETRHAALALRVFEWTERRLSSEAARRVREARRSCAADVLRELEWTPPPELVSLAGVPRRADALRLARVMTEQLWS